MFSSIAQLVQYFENPSANPSAQNPTSSASGLYQMLTPTWQAYANQIGVNTALYPTAASAPVSVQNAVFNQMVSQNGLNDYTCTGCDPALANYVAANPGSYSLPVFPGGATAASYLTGSDSDNLPLYDPETGVPLTPGPGTVSVPNAVGGPLSGLSGGGLGGFLSGLFGVGNTMNWIEELAIRALLIFLGAVLFFGGFVIIGFRSNRSAKDIAVNLVTPATGSEVKRYGRMIRPRAPGRSGARAAAA
jgi:hypothetical protein